MNPPAIAPTAIVEAARAYLGTPWHHDARVKSVGVDCIGLLVCVLRDLGARVEDVRGYGRGDEWATMVRAVSDHADPVPPDPWEWLPGDALLIRNESLPPSLRLLNHCGIYNGDGGMIHAWASPSVARVTEHPLDAFWMRSLAAVYRFRGVAA